MPFRRLRYHVGVMVALASAAIHCAVAAPLESLPTTWPELSLKATLGSGASPEVEQGSNLQLRIAGEEEASVAVILLNAEGKARVSVPHRDGAANRLVGGTEMLFPDTLSGETLYADMPVGKGTVFVVASETPIFEMAGGSDKPQWVPAENVEARIRRVIGAAGSVPRIAVRRLPLYILAPAMKEFVPTEDLVQFFGVSTRSADKPSLALRIEFATNSADLTDWSRRQLDSLGNAMLDAKLARDPFMIEGHTDDVGAEDYNVELSRRRAQTVVQYLERKGVGKARLRASGVGESDPAVSEMTEAARAKNRRVVVRRLDGSN